MAVLHFLEIRHIKELLCLANVYVMLTDDPDNITPKKKRATRAPPGHSLIKEEKKKTSGTHQVKTNLTVSSL